MKTPPRAVEPGAAEGCARAYFFICTTEAFFWSFG